jgi:hypothetical protein
MRPAFVTILVALVLGALSCSRKAESPEELAQFPLDDLEAIITRTGVSLDTVISSDGAGALRIEVSAPTVIRLFELDEPDVEAARLIYRAKLRSEDLEGIAYLEMWCGFPGQGEFFSRGLESPISGTMDWTTHEIPFFLKKGETPEIIKLNLGINGTGTVWIDDIHVLKAPLP